MTHCHSWLIRGIGDRQHELQTAQGTTGHKVFWTPIASIEFYKGLQVYLDRLLKVQHLNLQSLAFQTQDIGAGISVALCAAQRLLELAIGRTAGIGMCGRHLGH